ncbi:MAG: type II 3-dehydroquinate dehydratase [Chitinophagaceae bacterium]|jgi:3-dehydroquinate dehydratase-2|nr:type II 3-dehydroquinate dehydratase [Chitinophagaceae bacterium]
MKIAIINGPNLNLVGKREPEMYGHRSMDDFMEALKNKYADQEIDYFQSNVEGELINELQRVGFSADSILLNAGAYTHTSIAIADAVKAISSPVIEIHLSNIFAREEFRKQSFLSPVCKAIISGFGLKGYELAIESLFE